MPSDATIRHTGTNATGERSLKIAIRSTLSIVTLSLVSAVALAQCPQYRETAHAPDGLYQQSNPLEQTHHNLRMGKRLYRGKDGDTDCVKCHGKKGDGRGPLAHSFAPMPRNFTCAETMNPIPDGQLFWIIRNGSPNTSMPAHPKLSDEQVWQLVMWLREMADD